MSSVSRSFPPLIVATLLLLVATGCRDPQARLEEQLQKARDARELGRSDEALEILGVLGDDFPSNGEVFHELALTHERLGDDLFAAPFLEQAAALDPAYLPGLRDAARLYRQAGAVEEAVRALEAYLESYPEDVEALRTLAEIQRERGKTESALSAYLRAERIEGPSRNPEFAVEVGEIFLEMGNLPQAEAYFQTALSASDEPQLQPLLGLLETAYLLEEFAQAGTYLARIDENFPGALASTPQARIRPDVEKWRRSQEELAREMEELARLRAEAARAAEAEAEGTGEADEVTADSGETVGEGDAVVEDAGDGESPAGGKMAGLDEDTDEETPPADKILADDSAEGEPEEELPPPPPPEPTDREEAAAMVAEGRTADAIQFLWRRIRDNTEDPELWAAIAETYLADGQPGNAELMYLEALRRRPRNVEYTIGYLDVVDRNHSRRRYFEELERAYNRLPDEPDMSLVMARAYARNGFNPETARFFYERFLEMAPDHPEASEAVAEMERLP